MDRRSWLPRHEKDAFQDDIMSFVRRCSFFNKTDFFEALWERRKSVLKNSIITFFFSPQTQCKVADPRADRIYKSLKEVSLGSHELDVMEAMLFESFYVSFNIVFEMHEYLQPVEDLLRLRRECASDQTTFEANLGAYMSTCSLLQTSHLHFRKPVYGDLPTHIYCFFLRNTHGSTVHGLASVISNLFLSLYGEIIDATIFLEMAYQIFDIYDAYVERNSIQVMIR